ncbi:MAG: hypothetical protein PHS31_02415 [Victivallaceae bacterium]|nr:hypothetical protein [Victivallaceae bacterium]
MKEGFWGNYQTGEWHEIDEHEKWLRRGGNAKKLGVLPEIIARFSEFDNRETLLPFAFANAPVMRWRGHGPSVTFEFNSESWEQPLSLISIWCKLSAGPYLCLRMVNFHSMEIRETLWKDWNGISD